MKREELLDLNEALQYPGKKLVFQVSTELATEEDIDILEPVVGSLEGISTGNVLLIDGSFVTKVVMECARCGSPLELEVRFIMEDEFQVEGTPSSFAHDGFAKVVSDEPEAIFQGNSLIRDAYVRQGLLLNLPIQPLCSGSWDIPCPQSEASVKNEHAAGHPSFQLLSELIDQEKKG